MSLKTLDPTLAGRVLLRVLRRDHIENGIVAVSVCMKVLNVDHQYNAYS